MLIPRCVKTEKAVSTCEITIAHCQNESQLHASLFCLLFFVVSVLNLYFLAEIRVDIYLSESKQRH